VLNLTIDIKLQRDIEAYLAEQLERLRNRAEEPMLNARAGSVVVLDLHTGAVLAMVTHPQYDPNEFAGGITQARFDELQRLFAFVNRSVANTYPPGSAFKMAAALAGLEAGVISRSEQVLCTGRHWMVPTLACWKEGGHGYVDVEEALAVSCNVFFYEVGRRVGVDAIARYAAQLGLGSLTGIDLPSEQAGILPTTAWKRERFPREPQFFLAEHMMAAMGQGFHRYTPLQMAVFAATLATGYRYQPFVVESITGGGGEVIYRHQPRVASQLQVAPENLAVVRRGMLNATRPGGTAAGAFWGFGIPVAGKTGTAEVGNGDAHGWFVGYAPYHQPQVAIAVLLEHGGSAGLSAAPLARRVLARVLRTR
jgi:penicillin-binding protein 2